MRAVWFGILILLSACGYTLRHRLKDTFQHSKGIFVPVFLNRTEEVGAEKIFTNALIRELSSGREVILADRKNGGLELQGVLTGVEIVPTAQTELGFKGLQPYRRLPSELGVRINLVLTLKEIGTERQLWSKTFSGFRRVNTPLTRTYDYDAPSSFGPLSQSVAESVYGEIARMVMNEVYDEMLELF